MTSAVDKWPACARLSPVAPAGNLSTAPSSMRRTRLGARTRSAAQGVTFGREKGVTFARDLTVRSEEERRAEQAETAYRRLTEGWARRGRRAPTGATSEERLS